MLGFFRRLLFEKKNKRKPFTPDKQPTIAARIDRMKNMLKDKFGSKPKVKILLPKTGFIGFCVLEEYEKRVLENTGKKVFD